MKTKLIKFFSIFSLFILVAAPGVSAFTQNDIGCISNSTCFYDPSASGDQCTGVDSSTSDTTDNSSTASVSSPSGSTSQQQVAQTFVVGFDVSTPQSVIEDIVSKYHIGGLFLTGGSQGSASAAGFNKQFFDSLNQAAGTPLTIASDEEGGEVYRFDHSDISGGFPSAKQMGTMSDSQVEQIGKEVANDMTNDGVNVDLAPVLDLDDGTNIISQANRSFSSDPNTVAEKAGAFAKGLEDGGVTPIFKHFPGFGGAGSGDTDDVPVVTPSSYNLQQNIIPYKALLGESQNSNAGVMLSNIYVTGLTDGLPTSISPKAVNYLKSNLGFDGLITTDDLSALSASGYGSKAVPLPAAVTDALNAGVDMPLFSLGTNGQSTDASAEATMQAVINAASSGVSSEILNAAVGQVTNFKSAASNSATSATTSSTADSGGCCDITTATDLSGNDNEQKVFNYLVGKGLSAAQASGIMGNLMVESNFNPTADETKGTATEPTNNDGFGIAQWTFTATQQPLEQLASQEGLPVTDLGVQLDFLWQQLTTTYSSVLQGLQASTDVDDATNIFLGPDSDITKQPVAPTDETPRTGGYENPETPNAARRVADAEAILAQYGGGAGSSGELASTLTDGSCSNITSSGQDTQYIDNFTIYNQCDPTWATDTYGDTTICDAGCGPTSMAMIITNLTGQSVTPNVTAAYADSQNLYVDGRGSSWSIGPVLAKHWNLKATALSPDVGSITTALQSGALVIAPGTGPLPFTGSGHFIVIRGVTADGQWEIGDPGHSYTSSQEWDPQQLVASIIANGGGGVYAISK